MTLKPPLTRVQEAGGQVVMPATKVLEVCTMAVVTDPEGAYFCLWAPNQWIGATMGK